MATRNDLTSKANPDEMFLTVTMVVLSRRGVQIAITDALPEIYTVRFRLVGKISKNDKFNVHLVYPLDGYPFLSIREENHLVHSLNDAVALQAPERRVSEIRRPMIQFDEQTTLPRRLLRIALGTI